jgi:DNA-binding Lrp family transcriptional regulator
VEQGVIRDVSPVFDLRTLGYASTLAALDVPPDRVEEVAALVGAPPEVTHNYLREGRPNLWFTVIAESPEAVQAILGVIEREAACGPVHNLPATRMFKAKVVFDLDGKGCQTHFPTAEKVSGTSSVPLSATDWSVIEQLQEGIPLEPRPFDALAQRAGLSVAEFVARIAGLHASGVLRRMGVRVRHHKAGIAGNVLSVWRVADENAERVGETFSQFPEVTHCYTRPAFEGFPYNLYAMVSASTPEAAQAVLKRMSEAVGLSDYVALKTGRELKKSTPRYRRPRTLA